MINSAEPTSELRVEDFVLQYPSNRNGWIYVIQAIGTTRYKIGRSIEPKERLRQLNQKQSPYPLKLIHTFWSMDAVSDEQYLHSALADFRVHGEWFEFEDDGGFPWLVSNIIPNKAFMTNICHPFTQKALIPFLNEWFSPLIGKTDVWSDEECSSVIHTMLEGFEWVENRKQLLFWARFLDYRVPLHIERCRGMDCFSTCRRLESFMEGAWDTLAYFSRTHEDRHDS